MVSYPVELLRQQDGSFRVVSPHFPELVTFGDSEDDAIMHARYALEEVIAARIAKRQVVPVPIKTDPQLRPLALSDPVTALLERYWKYNLGMFAPGRKT